MGLLNWLLGKPETNNNRPENKISASITISSEKIINENHVQTSKKRWEGIILERGRLIREIDILVSKDSKLGITALRKPLAKIDKHLNQIGWQVAQYENHGVSQELIKQTQHHKTRLHQLHFLITRKISAIEAKRKPRKSPVSASTLSTGMAKTVDEIIKQFNDAVVLSDTERRKLIKEYRENNMFQILNQQDINKKISREADFPNKKTIKSRKVANAIEKDLKFDCIVVAESFHKYRLSGTIPAPAYPLSMAILLRKSKDHDRERMFLAAWCRHFPTGNGVKFETLFKRAEKTGAFKITQDKNLSKNQPTSSINSIDNSCSKLDKFETPGF